MINNLYTYAIVILIIWTFINLQFLTIFKAFENNDKQITTLTFKNQLNYILFFRLPVMCIIGLYVKNQENGYKTLEYYKYETDNLNNNWITIANIKQEYI